jgi:hypothetical protein
MASYSEVVIRIRKKVLDPRIAAGCTPSMPDDELSKKPCLGVKVPALSGSLQTEFSAEHLQLSPFELTKFAPKLVSDLGNVVYQRIRSYDRKSVEARVIQAIKSTLPAGTVVTKNTQLGPGVGLNLTAKQKGGFAKLLQNDFNALIRLSFTKAQAVAGVRVDDWITDIRAEFAAQGR